MKKEFNRSKNKVQCNSCARVDVENSKCSIKKASVVLKKKRYCKYYEFDSKTESITKSNNKSEPWHLGDMIKKDQRQQLNALKGRLAKAEALKSDKKHQLAALKSNLVKAKALKGDEKYPLSGNLDRFTTSS